MLQRTVCKAITLGLLLLGCAHPQVVPVAPQPPVTGSEITALIALMQAEDTRSFDDAAFAALSSSPSSIIRAQTALAAGRIKDRAAVRLLLHALNDSVVNVRANAAFALGLLGDTSAATALGALSRADDAAGAEAMAALGKIGGPAARTVIEGAPRTRKSGPAIQEALLALWRFPRQPGRSQLLRPFTSSADPELRWRAVYSLIRERAPGAGGPDPADVPAFQQWLRDPNATVRTFAARGLRAAIVDSANLRAASARALLSALHDTDPHVRISATNVLAGYRTEQHATPVAALLTDPDLNVGVAAAQALGLIKGPTAANALESRIRDNGERAAIRGIALTSLVAVDAERGVTLAAQFANSTDALARLYAARALAGAHTTQSLTMLRTLARDSVPRVAAAAVAATANIAGDTLKLARAFFIEALAAADPFVRAEALGGLERLAQPGDEGLALDAFARAVHDTDNDDGPAGAAVRVIAKLATNNPAVQRAFLTRFPLDQIASMQLRKEIIQRLKLNVPCCAIAARPEFYAEIVNNFLVPALWNGMQPHLRVTTAAGSFDVELLPADAPITVYNFLSLVRKNYFSGSRWHRVVPNFVLQDGDPTGTGSGGPGYAIRDELNRVRYLRGAVGMALSGPDTGGSQFFITHSPQPHLDGGYTVFGRVVSGMEVADAVIQDDLIVKIEIIQ